MSDEIKKDTVDYRDPTPFDDTKLNSVSEISKGIRHKLYGKDTREAIAQQGEALVKLMQETGGNQSAEVIAARGNHGLLSMREDAQDNAIDKVAIEVKGARTNSNGHTYPTLNARLYNQENDLNNSISEKLAIMRLTPQAFANEAALRAKYPQGNDQLNVTVDTGHLWIWYDGAWKDCGQYQTANILQDQIDLIKQQTLDFDNRIVNSAAINSTLGNHPFSAIGNVRLELEKGGGAHATNNDVSETQKGISITVANSDKVYYFDETLTMCVRNNDSSPHTFLVDYVAVKTDGTRLSLCSPLTKFNIPAINEVNTVSTLPRINRLSTVPSSDIGHFEIMIYTQSDASCKMSISTAKISDTRILQDINNADKVDNDNLLSINDAFGDMNTQKVFVEGLNKTCQRFYTNAGKGVWTLFNIPMPPNATLTQHIKDEKLDRPLKGSITVKIANDNSAINKYVPSFRIYDTSGKAYIYDIPNANARLSGNTLKYVFTLPSINNIAPNISFDFFMMAFAAYSVNFDVTLVDASLKFDEGSTTVRTRKHDDLGVNIMKSLNDGDNTFVSTSGAVKCTIDKVSKRNAFIIVKDLSSNTGTISILLPDFAEGDLWITKQLELFVENDNSIKITMPMQLTFHLADGTTATAPLSPLFMFHAQTHHKQVITNLYNVTSAIWNYVTLDISVNDSSAWTIYLKDISFKTRDADGTQDMTFLPDKSAKLPQLRLFGGLDKLKSKDDKIVIPCSLVNHEQVINGYAQVKWQGTSTLYWPKKSYTITLFHDPQATDKYNFKPMPNFYLSNKFTAKADYIDRFHVRNGYGAWLFKEILQTRHSLPSFFKTMNNFGEIQIMPINIVYNNGNYGIYTLQTKKSNGLYGMDKNQPNDIAIQGIGNTDGARWQKDTVTFDPDGEVGDFELISDSDKHQNVQTAINRLATFINSSTDDVFKSTLDQYVDIDSLCDLVISVQLTQNFDSIDGKNTTYITHDALKWYVQAYDMDSTLGTSWQPGTTQDDDVQTLSTAKNKLLTRFLQLFPDAIKTRFDEIDNSGVIAPFRMQEKFKSMVDSIGEYNFEQDNAVWPNPSYDGKDLSYILWLINHRYYFTKKWISNL